jgi:hypothetical protein
MAKFPMNPSATRKGYFTENDDRGRAPSAANKFVANTKAAMDAGNTSGGMTYVKSPTTISPGARGGVGKK